MANRILAGYPQPVGGKYEMIVDHDGPASYVNSGTFGTSGDQLNAADFGVGGFEAIFVVGDISSDGVNGVIPILGANVTTGVYSLQPVPPSAPGPLATTAVLHWYTTPANGTEVTNATALNTKYVRLLIRYV